MATINDKVYLVGTHLPYEGESELKIFANKETAIEEAENRAKKVCEDSSEDYPKTYERDDNGAGNVCSFIVYRDNDKKHYSYEYWVDEVIIH